MEWTKVAESLVASGPLAGCLAFALWIVWKKLLEKEAALDRLQEKRVEDLRAILTRSDD